MEVLYRLRKTVQAFFYGCLLGVLLVFGGLYATELGLVDWLVDQAWAATGVLEPNQDSATNGVQGLATGSCGGSNAGCLADGTLSPTAPDTTNYVIFDDGEIDYYLLGNNLTDVATATAVRVYVYHQETNANEAVYVSLYNAAESATYGVGEIQLPTRSAGAQWDDQANFTGLTLSQSDITGLRVRIRCERPGGGARGDCNVYALYAEVTYDAVINVTVSTIGNQRDLSVPTSSAHVGGAFVITENTGSRNITDITITEHGSVDAQNDLDNIALYYETSGNCSLESYDGTEALFGSIDTNGFSAADGISAFTDAGVTIDVASSTASELCVYPVLDVLSSAGAGETVEIRITDPSVDVDGTGTPSVEPNTPLPIADTTTLLKIDLQQTRYHWRSGVGDEGDTGSGANSLTSGSENVSYDTAAKSTNYRIRLEIDNAGNATSSATQYRLEYGAKVTDCSAISNWIDVGAGGGDWDMALSGDIADGNTTNITNASKGALTDDGVDFVGTGALRETTSLSGSITLDPDEFTELEYSIIGDAGIVDGTTYCFRATSTNHVVSYTSYPEITFQADLFVAGEEAQPSSVTIPTNNVVLGSFLVSTTSSGSRDINTITITASSTVANITSAFDNIEVWYETDTSAPLDCSSEGFGVGGAETQFGGSGQTDTDGFSGGGVSTFTGGVGTTPTANTSQAVCLYVVLDVTSSSTDGDTLDIKIQNPATDVVLSAGSAAPTSVVELTGVTTLVAPFVEQLHYHWRQNNGTEANASSSVGTEDTSFTELPINTVQRLRIGVGNTGGQTSGNYQYQLEWAQKLTVCDAVTNWINIDDANDEWEITASQLVDNADTTDIAPSFGGVTNVGTFLTTNGAQQDVNGITGNIDLSANGWLELEYSVRASTTVTEGATYCFRVTNNGTPLSDYATYPEATIKLGTDFAVYRGIANITGATLIITEGTNPGDDYDLQFNDSSRAFIRITNTHHTGGGPAAGSTGNNNADDVTAYISNPGNIATSITFQRAAFPASDTRVAWEIIEYIGPDGGDNEFIVRSANTATYVAADVTVTSGAISGVVDDADMVPFITSQYNPDTQRQDYNTGISTAAWNTVGDTITFTRGEAGADATIVSYAAVEFTGANWSVYRAEHTYSSVGVPQSQSYGPIASISRAFVHAQHRAGANLDSHANFGHEVWLSGMSSVSFELSSAATTPSSHTSVAWIVYNAQTTGTVMKVHRSLTGGTIPAGGGGLTVWDVVLDESITDLTVASLFVNSSNDGTGRTFPEPMISATIISETTVQLQVSDDGDANNYRYEVVEWPTASAKLIQNDYRWFEDNDALTPTVPWAGLGENAPMTANSDPLALGENARLRMTLLVSGNDLPAGADTFRLEYGELVTTCDAVSDWSPLGEVGSTTALWRGHNGTPADGATLSSTTIGVADTFGTYEEQNPTALVPAVTIVDEDIEYDWNIEHNGAKDKTSYCFRMVYSDGIALETPNDYPIARTVGYEPEIGDWKWFDDEGSATPSTALSATNSAPTDIAFDNIIKLRTVITEKSGATGVDTKFKVQFSEYPDFATAVYDVLATSTCNASSTWCYADAAGIDNAQIVDNTLGGITCNGGGEIGCGTHNEGGSSSTATFDHLALTSTEFEFTLVHKAARANAVYYFRLVDVVNNEVVTASSSYPSLVTEGAALTFTLGGVAAGELIDGELIDVSSATTSISFGEVPFDTAYTSAYRLHVDTNATEGYKVLMIFDQPLTNSYGYEIAPITGTNAAPLGWSSSCADEAESCFGYHVEDDLLDGGSSRFAANDTFAAISTSTAQEVMYSSVPAEDEHDIVFKLLIRDQQPAGDYTATMSFISIPIF